MSWQIPHAPLLGRLLLAQLLGMLGAAVTAALVGRLLPGPAPVFPLDAALGFGAVAGVAFGYVGAHHPFTRFGAANSVTTARAMLVAVVAALVAEAPGSEVAWAAALLGTAATVLDGVDGWLARRASMSSAFGARFDMETDALLILVLAVIAWRHDKAGAWVVLSGALRYGFVAAGAVWKRLDAPLPPSLRRKAICVVQIVGLILVVSPVVSGAASRTLAAVTLAALCWSFGVDVLWLRRHRV